MTALKIPRKASSHLANFAAAVQLTHAKPRTAGELSALLGITLNTARGYLEALADEGLADMAVSPRQGTPHIYTWVPLS